MQAQARLAGCCYLIVIACGAFVEIVVRQSMLIADDAASTAEALAANESLWRWGLAIHVLYLVPAALTNLLLFQLFKDAEPTLAKLMLILGIVAVTVEASALAFTAVPLVLIDEPVALEALAGEQGDALAYLAIELFSAGWGIALVFFAGFCVLLGTLISSSGVVPRALGALMILAGGCYLVSSMTSLIAPAVSSLLVPWILLPCLLGELTLAVWLTAAGVQPSRERVSYAH